MLINQLRLLGGHYDAQLRGRSFPRSIWLNSSPAACRRPNRAIAPQWRIPFVNSLLASRRLTNNSLQEP
jgi:hypothetical protein